MMKKANINDAEKDFSLSRRLCNESMRRYISLSRKKHFHEQTIYSLGIIAGSKEAIEAYGSTKQSFDALSDLVEKYDEQRVVDEFVGSINF